MKLTPFASLLTRGHPRLSVDLYTTLRNDCKMSKLGCDRSELGLKQHGQRERSVWLKSRRNVGSAVVCLAMAVGMHAQALSQSDPNCSDEVLYGYVTRGDTFDVAITDNVRFRLSPSTAPNPEGWTLQVTGNDRSRDYLMVATPPYRFGNPRYLDTSYGTTAEAALAWSPRTFQFVLNDADFDTMHAAVGTLLWPADHDPLEIERAGRTIESVHKGSGTFAILDAVSSPADENHPLGRIERVTFKVEVCL